MTCIKPPVASTKPMIQSKTLWFNLLLAAFAVLSSHTALLQSLLSDGGYLLLLMAVAMINVYLRSITHTTLTAPLPPRRS